MARRWAVTGSAGFIGGAVARRLGERGEQVLALDRRAVAVPGLEALTADITRPGPWLDALRDVDVVVHAAAIVAEAGDREAFDAVNVEGSRRVAAAAADAGARLVHLSSIVVYGDGFPVGSRRTEHAALRPTGRPYTDSKVAAEHAVLAVAAETGSPVTIVRPGDVYGPGSVPWVLRPLELMRRGRFLLVDGGRWPLSPVHVADLVEGVIAAAERDPARGRIYNLAGEPVPCREFFAHHAAHLGVRLRSLPRPAARAALTLAARATSLAGREPMLAPEALEYVTHPGGYDTSRARAELGWSPTVELASGLAEAFAAPR